MTPVFFLHTFYTLPRVVRPVLSSLLQMDSKLWFEMERPLYFLLSHGEMFSVVRIVKF